MNSRAVPPAKGSSSVRAVPDGEKPCATAGPCAVALVSMPFGPLFTPSIALGLLAAELRAAGYAPQTHYCTIAFAHQIGMQLYERLSAGSPEGTMLLGEWLFRDALHGPADPACDAAYLDLLDAALQRRAAKREAGDSPWQTLADVEADIARARSLIDPFLDACAARVLAGDPKVIGFTTVFQQNAASLALAKLIKARRPGVRIVFGGANCESVMGQQFLDSFPFVDHVVSGEGERAILDIAAGACADASTPARHVRIASRPVDLNNLPYPDYDDYFEQVRVMPDVERRSRLLFETSRGCWWGERSHCTFCGLNGTTMAFRSKQADRALDELDWLTTRFPGHAVSVVDNILDLKYFDSFIPRLQASHIDEELFYEVKANLKKEQLRQLRAAGITMIQPGIESLHDGVLQLMRKGVAAIQNVQLLKWSAELGIKVLWNFLWGFPSERPEWYAEMTRIIPLIRHLEPPDGGSGIRLDRFSPLFNDATLGARNVKPYPAYDFVYAELPEAARANLAYHFTFDYPDERDVPGYTVDLHAAIIDWNAHHAQCAFFSIALGDQLLLCDLRDPRKVELSVLPPLDARLYAICDEARTHDGVHRALADPAVPRELCARRLDALAASGAILHLNGKYLSLASPMGADLPSLPALQRFHAHLRDNDMSIDSRVVRVPVATIPADEEEAAYA